MLMWTLIGKEIWEVSVALDSQKFYNIKIELDSTIDLSRYKSAVYLLKHR